MNFYFRITSKAKMANWQNLENYRLKSREAALRIFTQIVRDEDFETSGMIELFESGRPTPIAHYP